MKPLLVIKKAAVYLPVLVAVLVSGYLLFTYPRGIVDDAYIYGRYANNLVHYGQLTWNIGEAPIEGYTGILLPLIYSVFFLLNINFQTAVVIVGFTSFLATFFTFWLFLRKLTRNPFLLNTFPYFVILAPFFYNQIFSGLETMLFCFLLMVSFSLFFLQVIIKSELRRPLIVVLLLLSLTRPEGLVFAFSILFFSQVILLIRFKKFQKSILISILAFFVAPLLLYFVWKFLYYGYLLPNTYYVKNLSFFKDVSFNAYSNFIFNNPYLISVLACIGIGILMILVNKYFEKNSGAGFPKIRSYFLPFLPAVLIPNTILLAQYSYTNLSMNIDYRFFLPTYLTFFLTISIFTVLIFENSNPGKITFYVFSFLIFAVAAYQIGIYFPDHYLAMKGEAKTIARTIQAEHIAIGKKLARAIPQNEKIAVIVDAGAIPFYSGLKTIDIGELNDPYLAHQHLTVTDTADYLLKILPAVIVVTSYDSHKVVWNGDLWHYVVTDARFSQYQLVDIYVDPAYVPSLYNEFVYVRDDLVSSYKNH